MASYHRVLKVFDRTIRDKSLECDCDIHPWEVLINGERWAGKVRLIGFVDVFFLMCYSADARFEKGIIIYKDDEVIRDTLKSANVDASQIKLDVVNAKEMKDDSNLLPKYFGFTSQPLDYLIIGLGHEVGLNTEYPSSSLIKYEIKILKSKNKVMKKRVRRAVTQHSLMDLMHDAIRLGVITHAEMTAQLLGNFYVGSATDDAIRKYMDTLGSASRPNSIALSNERS
ncbi:uncharacterized protein F4822DRAFT_429571 [Hypoxylon trugodes]|uniref:uncharacterized protein n=1 Tax=Hypoxylon trugodes TaxID=326681 RepID=UPI00219AD1C7|nr:uncharacterized protein F4822DRAFT_429571 [Hypoxylon trugodes]KAI1388955.1 hypothetical protein F4822DRAFT_429571 [Hypoxylon trugodes]